MTNPSEPIAQRFLTDVEDFVQKEIDAVVKPLAMTLDALQGQINADATQHNTDTAQIAALQGQVNTDTATITWLHNSISTLTDQHNADAATITGLQATVTQLQARIAELESSSSKPVWGYAHDSNIPVVGREASIGHPIPMRTYYVPGQEAKAIADTKAHIAAGRLVWLSFKSPNTWADSAAGKADAWFKDLLAKLGALNGQIWFTIHHEPEGDEPVQQPFWDMTKHFAAVPRPANIKFGPILIAWNEISGPQKGTMPTKWEHGDFLGWDCYQTYGIKANPSAKYWEIGPTYLATFATMAKGYGVPWAIAEFGISDDAIRQVPAALGWMDRMYQAMIDLGGCWGAFYFDSGLNSTQNITDTKAAWPLQQVQAKYDAWAKIAKSAPATR